MGGIVGSDGLTDEDRDESYWSESDKLCEGCEENVKYGDECIILRLVYPAPYNGSVTLLDALNEEDGSYTVDPLLFCFCCWDAYAEDLRTSLNELFITQKKSVAPSPLKCAFCQTALNWGDYCAHAAYGEIDVSPRTRETTFKASQYETVANAELVCLDCLGWINENCEENIWPELWFEEGSVQDGQEVVQPGV
jgi:hypothetical protein